MTRKVEKSIPECRNPISIRVVIIRLLAFALAQEKPRTFAIFIVASIVVLGFRPVPDKTAGR